MRLWLVSTRSFHTFLVRAVTEADARHIAIHGPAIDDAVTGIDLGYAEHPGFDLADLAVEEITTGPAGVLEMFS